MATLIGAVGSFIFAAGSTARQVRATYQGLIDEIDAPDLVVAPRCEQDVSILGCTGPAEQLSADDMLPRLVDLAVVDEARSVEPIATPYLVDQDNAPIFATDDDRYGCIDDDRSVALLGLTRGRGIDQAMPFRLNGQLSRPEGTGVVIALGTATREGIDIGDPIRVAGWCRDGDPVALEQAIDLTVTGISVGPLDIEPPDTGLTIEPAYVDPAVIARLVESGAETQANAVVWLDPRASPDEVREDLSSYEVLIDLRARGSAIDDALATDARLLWLLAGVGAVGGLLLLAPIVGKYVRDRDRDTSTLYALGAVPKQVVVQSIADVAATALIGAALAALLAPAIGVLMPRGFAETITPHASMRFDGTVTLVGIVLVIIAVVAIGTVASRRLDRRPGQARRALRPDRRIVLGSSHLRPGAHSGVLTAIGSPVGPRQPSPWPSFISITIAGATCVASLTYLAGLDHFERSPALAGWNWDAVVSIDEDGQSPPAVLSQLDRIAGVERATVGTLYPPVILRVADTHIGVWPWSFDTGPDAIAPTMVAGRVPDGSDEVAINALFADATGLGIGDSVRLERVALAISLADELEHAASESGLPVTDYARPDEPNVSARYEITGIAVLPLQRTEDTFQAAFTLDGLAALVEPSESELETAIAWLPDDLPKDLQARADSVLSNLDIGGRSVYLRLAGDPRPIAAEIARIEGVSEVVAPTAEQVLTLFVGLNLSHYDRVPRALVVLVSLGGAVLLAYLLYTAVRARRFEVAVMRCVGMTSGGMRWSLAAQATTTALVPLVVAVPAGLAVGRQTWLSSARDLRVLPVSVIPWSAITVIVASAIVFANLVVLVPGWLAARRTPASELRAG
ncbi:MAG TPA: ABC transporter permease [Ilumatobacteraceae bacterium]